MSCVHCSWHRHPPLYGVVPVAYHDRFPGLLHERVEYCLAWQCGPGEERLYHDGSILRGISVHGAWLRAHRDGCPKAKKPVGWH